MRFLIGLLAGAALVLTLLPLLDLRPTEIVEAFRAQWALARSVPAVSEGAPDVDPLPASSVTSDEQPLRPEPIEPDSVIAVAAVDVDDSDLSDRLETTLSDAAPDADSGWQSVWTPFYSQMSAEGFARRLTDTTERSFSVRKEAPGRYQVVFAYVDEQERAQVLEAFSLATGVLAP